MKYITLVPDGVADEPLEALGGKTPLQAAATPNMDRIAREGMSGLVRIIPPGLLPGSDVGNISVLGYDATRGFSGRAPLEAANIGIFLKDDELAFRCNLLTIHDDIMIDYSAGHISVAEAAEIMKDISRELSDDKVRFYTGKSYRHIAVVKSSDTASFLKCKCTPPHDITGKPIAAYRIDGPQGAFLQTYAKRAETILAAHPVNKARIAQGLNPGNALWFWGQGGRPSLEKFSDRYGLEGSIISAVDLVNGIGRIIGLDVITVPGATGYYDTNYLGKAVYGMNSLSKKDFIYIHVESTDEAGHNGDAKAKIDCIEKFDQYVVGTALQYYADHPDTRILVTPDHPTPVAKRTHTNDPVPFAMFGKGFQSNGSDAYNEYSALSKGLLFNSGVEMIQKFISS